MRITVREDGYADVVLASFDEAMDYINVTAYERWLACYDPNSDDAVRYPGVWFAKGQHGIEARLDSEYPKLTVRWEIL
jgi:hypothetical protein